MNLKSLYKRGRKAVDDRGGSEGLKADAGEMKDIAGDHGTLTDKAQDAEAIRDPGAPGDAGSPDPR
ncbi:MAG TPA: hypothetical protein VHV53_10255 [Solirubrobacterales bacterium]|nr:hypothetical protein [Solirubrobacterales bacterium]